MQRSDEAAAFSWGLKIDMSGGPKTAKQALGRPLDGGVRCLVSYHRQRRSV